MIDVQIRYHDNGRRLCCRRAEKSRLLAVMVIVAARRRRRPTRMTPQRSGCCERGGEDRQERRASKVKVTARIHQVNQALRLGSGCTASACCGMCVGRGGGWDLLGECCEKVGRGEGGSVKDFANWLGVGGRLRAGHQGRLVRRFPPFHSACGDLASHTDIRRLSTPD